MQELKIFSELSNYNYSLEKLSENWDKYQPNNEANNFNIPITERHFYGRMSYRWSQRQVIVIADAQSWSWLSVTTFDKIW